MSAKHTKSKSKTKRRTAGKTTKEVGTSYITEGTITEILSRMTLILEDMKNIMNRIECRLPYESSRFSPVFPETIPPYMQDDYKRRRKMPEPIMCSDRSRTCSSPF